MRELKFRYYSPEYKEMLPVLCIDFVNDCFYILPTAELEGGNQIEVKGIDKIEQFTGEHDKDKKKIFEGDMTPPEKGMYEVCTFNNGSFGWEFYEEGDCEMIEFDVMDSLVLDQVEIIGNIHENKEPLNG